MSKLGILVLNQPLTWPRVSRWISCEYFNVLKAIHSRSRISAFTFGPAPLVLTYLTEDITLFLASLWVHGRSSLWLAASLGWEIATVLSELYNSLWLIHNDFRLNFLISLVRAVAIKLFAERKAAVSEACGITWGVLLHWLSRFLLFGLLLINLR
jgi:hypothetical protein